MNPDSDKKKETGVVCLRVTLLRHLPVLADPENLQCFALRFQRNALNLQLQVDAAKLWTVVKVVDGQLPQTAKQHYEVATVHNKSSRKGFLCNKKRLVTLAERVTSTSGTAPAEQRKEKSYL